VSAFGLPRARFFCCSCSCGSMDASDGGEQAPVPDMNTCEGRLHGVYECVKVCLYVFIKAQRVTSTMGATTAETKRTQLAEKIAGK